MPRVGIGYDSHRFAPGSPLILGGQRIPSDRGLVGHSDADAVAHAVTDALLGAAADGDIGRHFPDDDPAWAGVDSLDLLRRTVAAIRNGGHRVGNVDVTIVMERPKLAPHVEAMRASLAGALGVDVGAVSVKAKTNEGMGFIGRGEGVAVMAVALLEDP